VGPAPAIGQDGGGSASAEAKKQKLEQLKKTFKSGMKAAKANQYDQAYTQLEQALQLAEDTEQGGAARKITGYLQKLPKKWGNAAVENKDFSGALTHFDKGVEHDPEDAYMYYGKGLALVNLDSTDTGLKTLQKAIEVGNETGNTRVTGLASQRIRDEFLAKASKALNAQNPSASQVETALSALDEMTSYVDPNAQSLFYRARALFEQGNFEEAIAAADKGLGMHQGSRSDAAKYHFIVAESEMQLGNKQTACATFQKAAFGDYKARSEHYLKNDCK
jgi:tetratricopeptide (TPR) repeat protein